MAIKGIDISEHNGVVNWERIKADGVKFVMLRASWGHFVEDMQLRRNVAECNRIGMPYGLYHYSYASTEAEARHEAEAFLKLARELPNRTYPLNLDMEDADHWKAKNGVGDDMNLKTIQIFKEVIEGAGEYLTLYMSKSWFDRLRAKNAKLIDSLDAWLAHWRITEPSMPCGMWQYTSDGVVAGSSARTDMNYAYKDYPAILSAMKGTSAPKPAETTKPSEPAQNSAKATVKPGDKVKIKAGAKDLNTGGLYDSWVYKTAHTVIENNNGRVVFGHGGVTGVVSITNIEGQHSPAAGFAKGDKVRIRSGAKDLNNGLTYDTWVFNSTFSVIEAKANYVVFGNNGSVIGKTAPANVTKA